MKKRSLKIWWTAVLFCAFGTTRLFADFTITNFDNSSIELLGTAATSGTSAVLVYDRSQVGGLFTTSTCDVDAFTVAFTFRVITPPSPFGAGDGLAFVISSRGPGANLLQRDLYGCTGLPNSCAIIFDSYDYLFYVESTGSDGASHVLSELTTVPNFADGQPHSAAISYSNHSLSISLDQQPLGAIQVDLSTLMTLTSNAAYLGFTASTGDFYYATHEITSWSYQHVSSLPDGPIILQIWAETPTSHILQFNGTSNLSYTLQYCDTLNSTSWQDLTNLGPLDATGPVLITNVTIPDSSRFYRLRSP